MGANIALNLADHGHKAVGFDCSEASVAAAAASGIEVAPTLKALVESLPMPRVLWVMVPCGEPTESCVTSLLELLDEGDILIDAGNSFFKDSQRGDGRGEGRSLP